MLSNVLTSILWTKWILLLPIQCYLHQFIWLPFPPLRWVMLGLDVPIADWGVNPYSALPFLSQRTVVAAVWLYLTYYLLLLFIYVFLLEKETFLFTSYFIFLQAQGSLYPLEGFIKKSHYLYVFISLFEVPFISFKKEQELQELW